MSNEMSEVKVMMNEEERKKANEFVARHLQDTMSDGRGELGGLRLKLSITYWVIICLSVVMFVIGIVLLSVPVAAAFRSDVETLQSVIAAGFGITDLVGLFLFRPIERIHALMGDMSQITLSLNSFQIQVDLRLMEMSATERQTIGQAAGHISTAAKDSIKLVQDYFEGRGKA